MGIARTIFDRCSPSTCSVHLLTFFTMKLKGPGWRTERSVFSQEEQAGWTSCQLFRIIRSTIDTSSGSTGSSGFNATARVYPFLANGTPISFSRTLNCGQSWAEVGQSSSIPSKRYSSRNLRIDSRKSVERLPFRWITRLRCGLGWMDISTRNAGSFKRSPVTALYPPSRIMEVNVDS